MNKQLFERLKEARKNLGLSQEYVSKQIGVHRSVITAMELGLRKVSSEELKKLSEVYGTTLDELVYGNDRNADVKMFARSFAELTEIDKKEIMNLIDFKKRLKKA